MRIPRIYVDQDLKANSFVTLDSPARNHLVNVLRLKQDANITLFNGQGGEYLAQIKTIERNKVDVAIHSFSDRDIESPLKIHLGQSISRGEKMDFTLQKSVELGVNEITPLLTKRCGVKLDPVRLQKRLQHWQAVIVSACEQCGRNTIPKLNPSTHLNDWLKENSDEYNFLLDPQSENSINTLSQNISSAKLLIGPEGGLTEDEINLCQQNKFTTLKLGPRILRTETAALAIISALQSRFGDMN